MGGEEGAGKPADVGPSRGPSDADPCRALVASTRWGTLCTLAREPAGFPYGSLVALASDERGAPLLLLSSMAEHRRNLDLRSEASVLVAEMHSPDRDPLARARATLLGRCARLSESKRADARESFLRDHPGASAYVDFPDFAFYRLTVQAIRYVGGFGRMSWVNVDEYADAKSL